MANCSVCGLPQELCVCETIAKESQKITVKIEKRKFGKQYTVVSGLNGHEVDIKDLVKKLKSKFACGGTGKDGFIELQGNHSRDMKNVLVNLGFSASSIEIKTK